MARLVVKQDEHWEKQRAKWSGEVGRFVMAFGSMEAITYAAMRQLPSDPIATPLIEAKLGLRLDLLLAIANGHGEGSWAKLAKVLEKVKQLSGKRNLVAHNGLGYDIYENASGEVFFDEVITSFKKLRQDEFRPIKLKDDKYRMSFDDLVRHRKQAEKLELELMAVMMDLFNDIGQERAERKAAGQCD